MKQNQNNAPLSKKVGDKIERAGQKISDAGATKVGNFISRMGDKLEHAGDERSETHHSGPVNKTKS